MIEGDLVILVVPCDLLLRGGHIGGADADDRAGTGSAQLGRDHGHVA